MQIQTVLYGSSFEEVARPLPFISAALPEGRQAGVLGRLVVSLGDCSTAPVLSEAELDTLRREFSVLDWLDYTFFESNLGHGGGQNRLFASCDADATLILNPGVLLSPNFLVQGLRRLESFDVGLVEGKQLPIEHPKAYDPGTGDTSWASCACVLARTAVLRDVHGFDSDNFFMHCDDVDLSWRVRLAGYRVVYEPAAAAFHDKRIGAGAEALLDEDERFFVVEGALLLMQKYSRPDLVGRFLRDLEQSDVPVLVRAARAFQARRRDGRLPRPIDPLHRVAEFSEGAYGPMRFRSG